MEKDQQWPQRAEEAGGTGRKKAHSKLRGNEADQLGGKRAREEASERRSG